MNLNIWDQLWVSMVVQKERQEKGHCKEEVKWRDRVQEYVRERGERSLRNLEQVRGECQDRERWKLFCHGHPLVGAPRSRRPNELN